MLQFSLSPEHVGLSFLLLSALYGVSSPGFGWLADRLPGRHHRLMMMCGLLLSALGLLLLGPSPLLPFLPRRLWLDLVALSVIGVAVALALLPTFPAVLAAAL